MNKTISIFLACAIGAFIGALIALEVNVYFWAGLIPGGLIGYLLYDPRAVMAAVSTAWQSRKGKIREGFAVFREILPLIIFGFWVIGTILFPLLLPLFFNSEKGGPYAVVAGIYILGGNVGLLTLSQRPDLHDLLSEPNAKSYLRHNGVVFFFRFLHLVFFTFLGAMLFGLGFLKRILWIIYSQERLLCAVCAAAE